MFADSHRPQVVVEGQVLDVTSFLSEHPGFQPGGTFD